VTVELSFDGKFELTEDDADILIQISGGAILWQKERLLNVAMKSVPPNVDSIAWLDCDVIFERPNWVDEAKRQLKNINVIQLFSDVVDLEQMDCEICVGHRDVPVSAQGIVSLMSRTELNAKAIFTQPRSVATRRWGTGLAWAARREILESHGLYDAMIAGAGDKARVFAMYGQFQPLIDLNRFNSARREHFLNWAHPYHQAIGNRIGHIAGRLYHLWHGTILNRNYDGRHQGVIDCNFNPYTDIMIRPNGAWQWARPMPDLEKFFIDFFVGRREDG
jgi:hypothetical protein